MRYMLTDELWSVMEPHVLASKVHHGGPAPKISDRVFLEALLYWARTGVPWRDLPGEFGEWDAVYNRFTTWIYSGRLKRLFESLTSEPKLDRVRTAFIDSTVVRAHLHAAGARRKKVGSARNARRRSKGSAAPAAVSAPKSSSRPRTKTR